MVGNTSAMYRSMIYAKVVRSARPKFTKLPLSSSTSVCFAQRSASALLIKVLVILWFAFRTRACQRPLLILRSVATFLLLSGTELGPSFFFLSFLVLQVSVYFAATQVPLLPPLFSSNLISLMIMPRSTALHIS